MAIKFAADQWSGAGTDYWREPFDGMTGPAMQLVPYNPQIIYDAMYWRHFHSP